MYNYKCRHHDVGDNLCHPMLYAKVDGNVKFHGGSSIVAHFAFCSVSFCIVL